MHTEKNKADSEKQDHDRHQLGINGSENFLQSILDTTQNLIYIYDFEKQKLIFANRQILDATGYSLEAIENAETDLFTSLIHPDDLETVTAHRDQIRQDNGETKTMLRAEFRLRNKSGQYRYQLSRDVVFKRNDQGKAIQYIGVAADISDITAANEQLVHKNQELRNTNTELDSFSSIASHDLKEPLRKIMMFSKLIIDAEKNNISETSTKYLERVVISADRLQQLIDDLISYSRAGTEKIKYVKTDLNVLLKSVKSEMKEAIADKKATVSVSENLPTIPALKSQMSQLFVNLISNALKYSKKDVLPQINISCGYATEAELAPFHPIPETGYYKIAVADNGIGFPNEYKDVIFDAFKRLHGKDDYAGTGIGLAICKKIVNNHNGFITSNSEIGKGSEFVIFLPDGIKKTYH